MNKPSQQIQPLTVREAALGVVVSIGGAIALIGTLSALFALAPPAEAARMHAHLFPVPGERHTYGDGVGAGRGHQGQDIFARCEKRIIAARGGRVQYRGRDSAAGNYVVIDGRRTTRDYVYMHMKDRARVREGERVSTGERIGRVGRSGNATGCHLHFELWSGPGWYEGGDFMRSVTRRLKNWDSWS